MLKPVYGVSDSCSFQVRWFLTTRSSRWDMMRRRFDQASIGPCKAWLQILSFWTWFFEVQRPECIFWDDSILSNSDPPVTHQHYYLSIGFYYIALSFSSTFPVGFESQFNPQKYHQSFCQYPFVMLKNTLPTLNWARLNSVFSGVFFFCAKKKKTSISIVWSWSISTWNFIKVPCLHWKIPLAHRHFFWGTHFPIQIQLRQCWKLLGFSKKNWA